MTHCRGCWCLRAVHNLGHLGLGHLVGIDLHKPIPVLVHMHHDLVGDPVLVEKPLEHVHHELHRGVVVVQEQHAVEARPLGLRLGLGDDRGPGAPGSRRLLLSSGPRCGRSRPTPLDLICSSLRLMVTFADRGPKAGSKGLAPGIIESAPARFQIVGLPSEMLGDPPAKLQIPATD